MPAPGWVNCAIRADLIRRLDHFIETSGEGYGSRNEVIAAALREFLARHPTRTPTGPGSGDALDRMLASVEAKDGKTDTLARAMLDEKKAAPAAKKKGR